MYIMSYFKLSEFLRSDVATLAGIDNNIDSPKVLSNLSSLWDLLDSIRLELGFPIYVTSGYRCPELNTRVGGVRNSLHTKGRAADIKTINAKMSELRSILLRYYSDGILSEYKDYSTYFHIAL